MMRGDYVSPKPDLVMGTEASPRGLVYYDQQNPGESSCFTECIKDDNSGVQNPRLRILLLMVTQLHLLLSVRNPVVGFGLQR